MKSAYDSLMSIPIQIPDGIEMRVTLTDRRDPDDVDVKTFEPILSREAIFRDWTQVIPFAAAYERTYGDIPAAPTPAPADHDVQGDE